MAGTRVCVAVALCLAVVACDQKSSNVTRVPLVSSSPTSPTAPGAPGTPTPPTPPAPTPTLTAPTPDTPSDREQLGTLRPTLTVQNGTTDTQGPLTYEFQISDAATFPAFAAPSFGPFTVLVTKTDVPEGSNGKTSYTLEQDLQPATRFYWRARLVQGTTTSDWSADRSFNSKIAGYNRAGELYDPLIGETIGTAVGSTTFVTGKGIKLNNSTSYVRYQLAQNLSSGEFSVEVEGLGPNGPGHKLKVISMQQGPGELYDNPYQMSAQYRGLDGNPPNCITFKAVYGSGATPLEPDITKRNASRFDLNRARTYFWKATWGTEFRLVVRDGGVSGSEIYNYGQTARSGTSYAPNPHYAFLGSTNANGLEPGAHPGSTYRNVFIGNRPRPFSLGSALEER